MDEDSITSEVGTLNRSKKMRNFYHDVNSCDFLERLFWKILLKKVIALNVKKYLTNYSTPVTVQKQSV